MTLDDRISEILQRVDLDALVARLGGIEAKRSGGTTTFHCPNPGHEDRTPSFTVKDGRWKCWSVCAVGGDAIDLLVWLRGLTKAEAIDQLAADLRIERQSRPPSTSRLDLVEWCAARGWGPWVASELGLSLVKDDWGKPRIRFPFRVDGDDTTHQDRAVDPGARLRWLTPKGGKTVPYEVDRLRLAERCGHIFIVEGVTDVAALVNVYASPAVVGIPGAQAWRESWAASFEGLGVFVLGDNDAAGQAFRTKVSGDLQSVARAVWNVHVPERYGDVAEWCKDVDPEMFDEELIDAVALADKAAVEPAVHAVAAGSVRMAR